jgi:cysteine desulfuration protein SufE
MPDESATPPIPPSVARVLKYFRALSREDKMQALVHYSKQLEPLPQRFQHLDRSAYTIPECQTRVDLFPEVRPDGNLHFYADVDTRTSPTIAAFLSVVLAAVNDHPPSVALAIPPDFVRQMMESIGLGTREVGLEAMVRRIKRDAAGAQLAIQTGSDTSPAPPAKNDVPAGAPTARR